MPFLILLRYLRCLPWHAVVSPRRRLFKFSLSRLSLLHPCSVFGEYDEAGAAEIGVDGNCLPNAESTHNAERRTVGEAVLFVGMLCELPPGLLNVRRAHRNYVCDSPAPKKLAGTARFGMADPVTNQSYELVEYVIRCNESVVPRLHKLSDRVVIGIGRIQERKPRTGIDEDLLHYPSP